jgi:uncharacterized protein (DUF1800 family)
MRQNNLLGLFKDLRHCRYELCLAGAILVLVSSAVAQTPSHDDTVRFLEQSTFGPNPALIAHVQSIGFQAFLNEQFALGATAYAAPNGLQPVTVPTTCTGTCVRDNYTMYPLQVQFFKRALQGQDQVRQRVAFALQQIMVASGITVTQPSWMAPYLNTFDNDAFRNFRTLLGDITLNPAMGLYLNMAGNNKAAPNENYGREVLQLFSTGLNQLNQNGSVVTDSSGNAVPAYTQAIVDAFSRVFTGWNNCASLNSPACTNFVASSTPDYIDPMVVTPGNHDFGSKTLLNGFVLPAITGAANQTAAAANAELNSALDNIFNHASVGPFIVRNLIEHLVTSNPSPAYISRVAGVFNNNGSGVRGDLQAVVQAILMDTEARNAPVATFGHLTEPVLFITRLLRAFTTSSATTDFVLSDSYLPSGLQMSQDLFRSGSVFNYYPPAYTVPVVAVNGPEFALQSTSTAFARINFVGEVVYKTMSTSGDRPTGTYLDFSSVVPSAGSVYSLTSYLNKLLLHGQMSPTLAGNVNVQLAGMSSMTTLQRIQEAVYLIATSPEYFVER